ncbi:MAG: hypothetical protein ACLFVO_24290, partial [Chloroflexaceae bacterium]
IARLAAILLETAVMACARRPVHRMPPTIGCGYGVRPLTGASNAPYDWLSWLDVMGQGSVV